MYIRNIICIENVLYIFRPVQILVLNLQMILLLIKRATVLALIGKKEFPNKFKQHQRFKLMKKWFNYVYLNTEDGKTLSNNEKHN